MCAFEIFLSVDPSLGRLDYTLMPAQALMEMLVEAFPEEAKRRYQDDHGMYLDVCKWLFVKCDDDQRVIEIKINQYIAIGSLDLFYIPAKVKVFIINSGYNRLFTVSVDLSQLPHVLKKIFIYKNLFTEEIDLTQLPEGIERFCLEENQFSGEVDLTHLPDGMVILTLHNNQFTGEI